MPIAINDAPADILCARAPAHHEYCDLRAQGAMQSLQVPSRWVQLLVANERLDFGRSPFIPDEHLTSQPVIHPDLEHFECILAVYQHQIHHGTAHPRLPPSPFGHGGHAPLGKHHRPVAMQEYTVLHMPAHRSSQHEALHVPTHLAELRRALTMVNALHVLFDNGAGV